MAFDYFKTTPFLESATPSRYPFSDPISSVSPLPPDPFTGKPVKPVELADLDPFTNKPVAGVELREPVFPKTPPAAGPTTAAAAPAAPAPTEPWRPLQQRTMVNPAREAERKRKEALRGALQQQQQGPTQLSGEGSRRYINPEREAQRTSNKFGG